jgi:hypothetical protein
MLPETNKSLLVTLFLALFRYHLPELDRDLNAHFGGQPFRGARSAGSQNVRFKHQMPKTIATLLANLVARKRVVLT